MGSRGEMQNATSSAQAAMISESGSNALLREDLPPVRIGIDVTSAIAQGGGIGRYTRELVRALVTTDRHNEYRLFSAKASATKTVIDPLPSAGNLTYRWAPLSERWLYRLWYRLRIPLPVQMVTGALDLFHSPDFVLPPVAGSIPTLLTVHDLSFVHYPETFPPRLVTYLSSVVPWSIRRATHVLADSQATKQDLVDLWRIPVDDITVLYSGVDERFRPVTEADLLALVRDKYALGDSPYLLSVGTVQPRKNYQMLIRAFKPVSANWPHNLIIAGGTGWLADQMLTEVQNQGLTDRVRFLGFVDDVDLPALYSGASLFLFPSLYEGFGLPLLEAMACGVPTVTSNAASLPEVIQSETGEEAAVQLSPHDEDGWTEAIAELLGDPTRRTGMVARGFRQARRFTWRGAARQLLGVYQQLLGL